MTTALRTKRELMRIKIRPKGAWEESVPGSKGTGRRLLAEGSEKIALVGFGET